MLKFLKLRESVAALHPDVQELSLVLHNLRESIRLLTYCQLCLRDEIKKLQAERDAIRAEIAHVHALH
jgi:cell division protein FtsB